jgi:branched-subunit amino acid transport protein
VTELSTSAVWLVIVGAGVVTYLLRVSFLLGIDYVDGFPPVVERVLPFFPIAILSALIVPNLLLIDGGLSIGAANPHLLAGLVALVVAWYVENMLATVSAGMITLWVLLWLGFG